MVFFIPSDTVLNYLAQDDRKLKPYFRSVSPADKLPAMSKRRVNAYIVDTDPAGEPGKHCLAIWTRLGVCEVFYSFGLHLSSYTNPTLQAWFKQWKEVITSEQPLQAMDSCTCGHYALFFLKGQSKTCLLSRFFSPVTFK